MVVLKNMNARFGLECVILIGVGAILIGMRDTDWRVWFGLECVILIGVRDFDWSAWSCLQNRSHSLKFLLIGQINVDWMFSYSQRFSCSGTFCDLNWRAKIAKMHCKQNSKYPPIKCSVSFSHLFSMNSKRNFSLEIVDKAFMNVCRLGFIYQGSQSIQPVMDLLHKARPTQKLQRWNLLRQVPMKSGKFPHEKNIAM